MKREYGEKEFYFYLVQRCLPARNYQALGFRRNPFGYGGMGAFELDYMGSAEFEFGAIPESYNRLYKAGDAGNLGHGEVEINGKVIEFVNIHSDGDPSAALTNWVTKQKCDGKEPAGDFYQRIFDQENDYRKAHRTAIWWSLNDDVMFAFKEDGMLEELFKSLADPNSPAPSFRGGCRVSL